MAQENTARKLEETTEQAIARMTAENAALRAEKKAQDSVLLSNVQVEFKVGDKAVGSIITEPCTFAVKPGFKTGSRGFRGFDKLSYGGRRYQVNVQLVEIHSATK